VASSSSMRCPRHGGSQTANKKAATVSGLLPSFLLYDSPGVASALYPEGLHAVFERPAVHKQLYWKFDRPTPSLVEK
jgi:hypothetical protein